MIESARTFTPRIFWQVALTAAGILGALVTIPQWLSTRARLDVLRSHVAEVAQLAASVVDGDLHRQLIDPANYSPELYARTLAPLVRFHSADPEIFYLYTMVVRGDQSLFVLDTAASDQLVSSHRLRASAYMEPFETLDREPDADWLQRIAAGQSYVYPEFLRDEYGYFLSGHAPIHDSQGRYSGFIGVDFGIQYYLAMEARFRTIYIGTLAAAALLSLVIAYLAARYHHQLKNRIDRQYRLSMRDELTQLLNRRGAVTSMARAMQSNAASYATLLVDVDDLKGINDTYGHSAGDQFLKRVAQAIQASVSGAEICARLGGDEFLVFATGADLATATEIAQRILARIQAGETPVERRDFGVSIGICVASPPDVDFESMYRSADEALYRAKSGGKNRLVIFEPVAQT